MVEHSELTVLEINNDRVASATLTARRTWIPTSVEGDFLAVYLKTVLATRDVTVVCAVDSVVLEHVCSVLGITERVVDGHDLNVRVLHRSTQDKPADAAETIDANLDLWTLNHDATVVTVNAARELLTLASFVT